MGFKRNLYLGILFTALLVLALGGWLVQGVKALTGRSQGPTLRPRYT